MVGRRADCTSGRQRQRRAVARGAPGGERKRHCWQWWNSSCAPTSPAWWKFAPGRLIWRTDAARGAGAEPALATGITRSRRSTSKSSSSSSCFDLYVYSTAVLISLSWPGFLNGRQVGGRGCCRHLDRKKARSDPGSRQKRCTRIVRTPREMRRRAPAAFGSIAQIRGGRPLPQLTARAIPPRRSREFPSSGLSRLMCCGQAARRRQQYVTRSLTQSTAGAVARPRPSLSSLDVCQPTPRLRTHLVIEAAYLPAGGRPVVPEPARSE